MKVIQNILAINFILCLARHWLSNLRHQGTRCIGGEKIKGAGGGGGNIPPRPPPPPPPPPPPQ